jgi:hypothetical protein
VVERFAQKRYPLRVGVRKGGRQLRDTRRGGDALMWTLLWLAIVVATILMVVAFFRLARGPRR